MGIRQGGVPRHSARKSKASFVRASSSSFRCGMPLTFDSQHGSSVGIRQGAFITGGSGRQRTQFRPVPRRHSKLNDTRSLRTCLCLSRILSGNMYTEQHLKTTAAINTAETKKCTERTSKTTSRKADYEFSSPAQACRTCQFLRQHNNSGYIGSGFRISVLRIDRNHSN